MSGSSDVATLLDQVRSSARILAELVEPASAVGPELERKLGAGERFDLTLG